MERGERVVHGLHRDHSQVRGGASGVLLLSGGHEHRDAPLRSAVMAFCGIPPTCPTVPSGLIVPVHRDRVPTGHVSR